MSPIDKRLLANTLREEIRKSVESIEAMNGVLRDLGERPENVCMTPSDVPPYTWLPRSERVRAEKRFFARMPGATP